LETVRAELVQEQEGNHWLRLRLVSQEAASMLAVERMQVDWAAAKQARKERDVWERAAGAAQDKLEQALKPVSIHVGDIGGTITHDPGKGTIKYEIDGEDQVAAERAEMRKSAEEAGQLQARITIGLNHLQSGELSEAIAILGGEGS
jgi:hypothetical protein